MVELLMDDKTKDLVLAAMLARSEEAYTDGHIYFPDLDCINIIYNGTPEGSPARRLLVQFYTENNFDSFCDTKVEDVPKDFLLDLSISLTNTRPLLRHFTHVKDALAQKDRDYKKQLKTKDDTIQALKDSKANLRAQNQALKQKRAN